MRTLGAFLAKHRCTEIQGRQRVFLAISDWSASIFTRFLPKMTGCFHSLLLCSASTRCWPYFVPFRPATRTDQPRPQEQPSENFAHMTLRLANNSRSHNPNHKNNLWEIQSDVYRGIDSSQCCQFSCLTIVMSSFVFLFFFVSWEVSLFPSILYHCRFSLLYGE